MSCTRRRSDRSESARRRHVSHSEALESRQVLSTALPSYLSPWVPSDLPVTNPITHQREIVTAESQIRSFNPNSPGLTNVGKIVSGTDRAGNLWVITVHGPGEVIVTDTTAGKWYLYGGAASAGLGVVLTFVLSRRGGQWPRRVGAWPR